MKKDNWELMRFEPKEPFVEYVEEPVIQYVEVPKEESFLKLMALLILVFSTGIIVGIAIISL